MVTLDNETKTFVKSLIADHKYDEVLGAYLYFSSQDPSFSINKFVESFEISSDEFLDIMRNKNKTLRANELSVYTKNALDGRSKEKKPAPQMEG